MHGGGGEGEGRAYSRAGRDTGRKQEAKATAHAARAQSLVMFAKMGSS